MDSCFKHTHTHTQHRGREKERNELKENPRVDDILQFSQICIQEENYGQVQEIFFKQVIVLVYVQRSIVVEL